MSLIKLSFLYGILVALFALQGCSSNSFHLRKSLDLPRNYQQIQIESIPEGNDFKKVFKLALEEAGGKLQEKAKTQIVFYNFREGKRVVAYNKERKARIYLLFLKFEYEITGLAKKSLEKRRINLDRTFVYDANFALGKAEEEDQIRNDLYAEAARLILLRLKYSKK